MESVGISKVVADFLAQYIDSVVQLEVLLLLFGRREELISAGDVAHELRIDPAWTEAALAKLEAAGVIEARQSAFQYGPRTPQLDQTVAELAAAYEQRRVTIISMIFAKPVDPIRQFTDAFRLKKDEGN